MFAAVFIGLCSIKFVVMAILYAKEGNWKGFWLGLAIALTGGFLAFLIGAGNMLAAKLLVWGFAVFCTVIAIKCFRKKDYVIVFLDAILIAFLVLMAHLL